MFAIVETRYYYNNNNTKKLLCDYITNNMLKFDHKYKVKNYIDSLENQIYHLCSNEYAKPSYMIVKVGSRNYNYAYKNTFGGKVEQCQL